MRRPLILGLSASLRNARSKAGSASLKAEIAGLEDRPALDAFIQQQAAQHLEQFLEAGRRDGKPFDELYRNLQKTGGLRGLSNSEVCLVAALWAARQKGCEVAHVALADHFPATGETVDLDGLKAALRAADGIVLATPVYFGDRSSLAHRLIELIRADADLKTDLADKLYAGVAVGAKRNGGQETTLIYQMQDMINLGLLAVGNDSDTTSQYGGTAHAGDIGTIPKDGYGIETSLGTGRRIARVALELQMARDSRLADPLRLGVWMLQDRAGEAMGHLGPLFEGLGEGVDLKVQDLTDQRIRPCIACDICPTHVGPDEEYRCIIARRDDGLKQLHDSFLWPDVLMPTLYSPRDRAGLVSVYQEFMERTRYLRRGDYVFTDHLVVPLILEEVGAGENLAIRAMTSFIRHHTVMAKPLIGLVHEGRLINRDQLAADLAAALRQGRALTAGRLVSANLGARATQYNPVGYVLSAARDGEVESLTARERATRQRNQNLVAEASARLEEIDHARIGSGQS